MGSSMYATPLCPHHFIFSIAMPSRCQADSRVPVVSEVDVTAALGQEDQTSEFVSSLEGLWYCARISYVFSSPGNISHYLSLAEYFEPAQVLDLCINKTGHMSASVGQTVLNHCKSFMILYVFVFLACLTNKDSRRVNKYPYIYYMKQCNFIL